MKLGVHECLSDSHISPTYTTYTHPCTNRHKERARIDIHHTLNVDTAVLGIISSSDLGRSRKTFSFRPEDYCSKIHKYKYTNKDKNSNTIHKYIKTQLNKQRLISRNSLDRKEHFPSSPQIAASKYTNTNLQIQTRSPPAPQSSWRRELYFSEHGRRTSWRWQRLSGGRSTTALRCFSS